MPVGDHRNPDGTYNGVAVMSAVTRLPQAEVQRLWDEVRANHAKLNACPRHDFEPATEALQRRRICRACGGWADSVAVSWYERGLRDGASDG